MKKILLFAFTTILTLVSYAQLLDENFNYSTGQLTGNGGGSNVSGGAWTLIGGTVQLNVVSGSLTYPGYVSSNIGNRLLTRDTSASAEDAYTSFTPTSSGSIYYSFLLNVADTTRMLDNALAGDYMVAFLPSTSTTSYTNRLTFRKGSVGNTFNIGLRITSTGSTVVVWSPANYTPGTTYLIASQLVFIPGAANDSAYLWVNPVLNGTIPTPDVATVQLGASTDPVDVGRFAVRQSGGTPESFIDGIRVGTTWAASVLPVKLINFNAQLQGKQTMLTWTTASEVNNQGFEIQKSADGENFETIGFVKGAGNANQVKRYTFTDENNAHAYYRLKQVDFDGQFEYSNIVAVGQAEITVALTPNPFNNSIEVNGNSNITSVEIIDVTGKTRLATMVNGTQAAINTEDLSNGIYLMRINNGTTSITKRILKQ
jgi:hypothetical protein